MLGDVNVDHLVKVVSAGFSIAVTISPFSHFVLWKRVTESSPHSRGKCILKENFLSMAGKLVLVCQPELSQGLGLWALVPFHVGLSVWPGLPHSMGAGFQG